MHFQIVLKVFANSREDMRGRRARFLVGVMRLRKAEGGTVEMMTLSFDCCELLWSILYSSNKTPAIGYFIKSFLFVVLEFGNQDHTQGCI